jgi:hypothetical protein
VTSHRPILFSIDINADQLRQAEAIALALDGDVRHALSDALVWGRDLMPPSERERLTDLIGMALALGLDEGHRRALTFCDRKDYRQAAVDAGVL